MKFLFQNMKRQGEYVKNSIKGADYKSFKPSDLQNVVLSFKKDAEMDSLLIKIYENLAGIRQLSYYIKSVELFLYSYVLKEALESSIIEGTECTMQDVLSKDYIKEKNNIDDINEVISNINAINYAIKKQKELPLSTKLYKEIHKVLLKNVRGKNKNPGDIRKTQNWIGGNSIENARFVPPNVIDMNEALDMFDRYVNDEHANIDIIINGALIHYQFETIHPFLDGNGRLGRIIVLLYFIEKELLNQPIIYLSYYLKKYQSEYYDKLMNVRENGDYEGYVKFFLRCMNEATNASLKKIENLEKLHNKSLSKLPKSNRKKDTLKILFDYIEKNPLFSINDAMDKTSLSFNTINTNINILKKLKIVDNFIDVKRNKVFVYKRLLDLLKE